MKKLFLFAIFLSMAGCSTFSIDISSAKKILTGVDSYYIVKPDIKNESGGDLSEIFASSLAFSLKKKNYRVESCYSSPMEEKNYRYRLIIKGAVLKSGGVFDSTDSASIYVSIFDSAESRELALVRIICTDSGFSDTGKIAELCSGVADKIDSIVRR
jgi:hypothetical protein